MSASLARASPRAKRRPIEAHSSAPSPTPSPTPPSSLVSSASWNSSSGNSGTAAFHGAATSTICPLLLEADVGIGPGGCRRGSVPNLPRSGPTDWPALKRGRFSIVRVLRYGIWRGVLAAPHRHVRGQLLSLDVLRLTVRRTAGARLRGTGTFP